MTTQPTTPTPDPAAVAIARVKLNPVADIPSRWPVLLVHSSGDVYEVNSAVHWRTTTAHLNNFLGWRYRTENYLEAAAEISALPAAQAMGPTDDEIRKAVEAEIQQWLTDSLTPDRGYGTPIDNVKALFATKATPPDSPEQPAVGRIAEALGFMRCERLGKEVWYDPEGGHVTWADLPDAIESRIMVLRQDAQKPAVGRGDYDASRYSWDEENRTRGFDTLKAEIEHIESLGYKLVPPEYKIPHWSEESRNGEPLTPLFVNTIHGVRPLTAALDRYAAELGYPLFFKQQTAQTERAGANYREAANLAMAIWRNHYAPAGPKLKLLDDVSGVLSQISNMTAGLGADLARARSELADSRKELGPLRELVGVDPRAASGLHDIAHWTKMQDRADRAAAFDKERDALRSDLRAYRVALERIVKISIDGSSVQYHAKEVLTKLAQAGGKDAS